jgi:hypothetical protein
MHRFEEPVPADAPFRARVPVRLASSTREWPPKWTPAHPSKAASANHLLGSLLAKRTAAFRSALRARARRRFRVGSEGWQGQI